MSENVLAVKHLNVWYGKPTFFLTKKRVQVLHDISFEIHANEIVGLVGESGCGKSTLARSILGLEKDLSGEIRHFTYRPQMVFQNPYSSLNPEKTIGWIVEEPLYVSTKFSKDERRDRVAKMLTDVGLGSDFINRYPNELSGGQRQRAAIAAALIQQPKLIVLDEPVSALDVTVQAQILKLLVDLKERYRLSFLFISHDLNVVYQICDRVMVMQHGEVVESGTIEEVYTHPKHPYTVQLLNA